MFVIEMLFMCIDDLFVFGGGYIFSKEKVELDEFYKFFDRDFCE